MTLRLFFHLHKNRWGARYVSVYLDMSARKPRLLPYEGPRGGFTFPGGKIIRPKRNVATPEIDICSYPYKKSVSHLIPTECWLVVYFLSTRTRAGMCRSDFNPYKDMNLWWNVEDRIIGRIRLAEQGVTAMAAHLPPLCHTLCFNTRYSSGVNGGFWIITMGIYKVA